MNALALATPAERATIDAATAAFAEALATKDRLEAEHRLTAEKVGTLVRRAADLAGEVEKMRIAKQRGEMTAAQRARATALLAGQDAPQERGLEQLIDESRVAQDDVTITRTLLIELGQAVSEATRVWGLRRGELLTALTRPLRRRVLEALEAVHGEIDQIASLANSGAEFAGLRFHPKGIRIDSEWLAPDAPFIASPNPASVDALLTSLVAGTADAKSKKAA